jgi:hypothetical protein
LLQPADLRDMHPAGDRIKRHGIRCTLLVDEVIDVAAQPHLHVLGRLALVAVLLKQPVAAGFQRLHGGFRREHRLAGAKAAGQKRSKSERENGSDALHGEMDRLVGYLRTGT